MFGLIRKRAKTAAITSGVMPSGRKATLEPSVIASNVNVLGNMLSDGVLDIDGQIDGNVTAQMVTVRPNGRIRGDLIAREAVVHGTVDGLIKAQAVSLFSTATVNGTIMHETLMVEDGAAINGKLKRTEMSQIMGESGLGSSAAMNIVASDDAGEGATGADGVVGSFVPANDGYFAGGHDEEDPTSEKEIKILENLRLIS